MNPKFSVPLVQHTPIIHFQHQQTGASLRATEVKAKLDKFIVAQMGGWEKVNPDWKLNAKAKDNKALNYKLHIKTSGKTKSQKPDKKHIGKGYFGNMGDTPDKYLLSFSSISLDFFCLIPDLSQKINESLSAFFLSHNFGTRQNRGYGSFSLQHEINGPIKAQYSFRVYDNDIASKSGLGLKSMEAIDWFYKSLRQGINHGTFRQGNFIPYLYMKPMLFQYAISPANNIQWEKKTIKEQFFNRNLEQQIDRHGFEDKESPLNHSSNKKRIVRDLFGLSTEQSWKNYSYETITKKDVNKEINRYPSPLRFKPIMHPEHDYMTIYFWAEPIHDLYKNASFSIIPNNQTKRSFQLKMWSDFNMQDFFNFAFEEGRLENSFYISDERGAEAVQNLLSNIYQDIRNPI